jgi:hypothetical protein
LEEE